MSRLQPLSLDELGEETRPIVAALGEAMGFVSNDVLPISPVR